MTAIIALWIRDAKFEPDKATAIRIANQLKGIITPHRGPIEPQYGLEKIYGIAWLATEYVLYGTEIIGESVAPLAPNRGDGGSTAIELGPATTGR